MKKITKKTTKVKRPSQEIVVQCKQYQPISNCLLNLEIDDTGDFIDIYKQQAKIKGVNSFMRMNLSDMTYSGRK